LSWYSTIIAAHSASTIETPCSQGEPRWIGRPPAMAL
jgi:hypothetical protein